MLLSLTITLTLGWLIKKLIKRYPSSPYPRRLEKFFKPLIDLGENLVKSLKTLSKQKSAPLK